MLTLILMLSFVFASGPSANEAMINPALKLATDFFKENRKNLKYLALP
jgi:hypothetical protein